MLDRSAMQEMNRVLDVAPRLRPDVCGSGACITERWAHSGFTSHVEPMADHVVMTYYGAPQRLEWRDGSRYQQGVTRQKAITVIPSGHEAAWMIAGAIEVSHVYFSDARLQTCAEATGHRGPAVQLLDRVALPDPTASSLLEILASEACRDDAGNGLFVEQAVDLLCMQLVRAHSSTCRDEGKRASGCLANWQVRRVTEYLQERLDEEVRLDDLAKLAGLSRFYFCAAFRRSTGLTPHQWLLTQRMARARALMADPSIPLIQVALAVGYQTPSAFAAAFRRSEGMSPTEYRLRC